MKLRNKLIPLATVFATCATVTPVALTSCAATTQTPVDLLTYESSEKRAKIEGYQATDKEATELYIATIQADKNVFYDDIYNSLKVFAKAVDDAYNRTLVELKAIVSDFNVEWTKINDDLTLPICSYNVAASHKYTYRQSSESVIYDYEVEENVSFEYKNMPLYVYYNSYDGQYTPKGWYIASVSYSYTDYFDLSTYTFPHLTPMTEAKIAWSQKFDYTQKITQTTNHSGQITTYTEETTDSSVSDTTDKIATFTNFHYRTGMEPFSFCPLMYADSLYLSNIQPKTE